MTQRVPTPGEIEQAFVRAHDMQADLARRERAVGRRIQTLAKGLAALMQPGEHLHRIGVGIHAFDVGGSVCVAAAYLEEEGEEYRYRYAVLSGGAAAKQALEIAQLDPSDSDEPGARRRVSFATNSEYDDFLYRLPRYVADVNRRIEDRLKAVDVASARADNARQLIAAARRTSRTRQEVGRDS